MVSTRYYLGSLFRFSIGLPLRHSGCMDHPSLSILAWLGPPGSADDFERCDLEQQTISLLRTTALGLNSSDRIYWGRTRKGRWRKTSPWSILNKHKLRYGSDPRPVLNTAWWKLLPQGWLQRFTVNSVLGTVLGVFTDPAHLILPRKPGKGHPTEKVEAQRGHHSQGSTTSGHPYSTGKEKLTTF